MPWRDISQVEDTMGRDASWGALRDSVLSLIVPDGEDRERVRGFRLRVERELTERLVNADFRAVAEVHGSAARETWLAGEWDVDVFVILDGGYGREVLPEILGVVKEYVGEGWVEAYAEHPYVKADVSGFSVEFIPCFRVDPGEGLVSSTDRTPLHTEFVKDRLIPGMRDEVRLLKKFMKGVGVYGAEVKVGGFSGYLCELLVIHLGSFEAVLERAATWERGETLDPLGGSDVMALRERFGDPLIVPDPVDPGRNVASAVSETSFWTLTAAARAFLTEPKRVFFFPEEAQVDVHRLLEDVRGRDYSLLFVVVEDGDVEVPDVLWGQLQKSLKAISGFLGVADFQVMRSTVWSDEASRHVLVFELEEAVLPGVVRRMGPPVRMEDSSQRFVEAHAGTDDTVSGPWIEGERWLVEVRRPEPEARRLLAQALEDGGRDIGVSRGIGERMRRGFSVLVGDEIDEYLDAEFAIFLDGFLRGRPGWLD
jgi:tRNA nucleotidyltransferase (CCA-adding enzyme)